MDTSEDKDNQKKREVTSNKKIMEEMLKKILTANLNLSINKKKDPVNPTELNQILIKDKENIEIIKVKNKDKEDKEVNNKINRIKVKINKEETIKDKKMVMEETKKKISNKKDTEEKNIEKQR